MIQKLLTRIFGSRNERLLKDYRKVVERINALEPAVSALTQSTMTGRSTTTSPTGQGWRGPPAGVIREEIPAGRGRGDGFCP